MARINPILSSAEDRRAKRAKLTQLSKLKELPIDLFQQVIRFLLSPEKFQEMYENQDVSNRDKGNAILRDMLVRPRKLFTS